MNTNEAIQIANRWLGYLALQKARSERMQELARLARTDPKEAQRQMRQLDQQPHVFDGAELEPAVWELLTEIERLREKAEEGHRALMNLSDELARKRMEIQPLRAERDALRKSLIGMMREVPPQFNYTMPETQAVRLLQIRVQELEAKLTVAREVLRGMYGKGARTNRIEDAERILAALAGKEGSNG